MQFRENLLDNIHCAYLNFRKLDAEAISKLDNSYILNSEENIREFKKLLGFPIEQFAIIIKCNAIILIVIDESLVSESHFKNRVLRSWDKLSKGGISTFSSTIKFKKGEEASSSPVPFFVPRPIFTR